LLLASHTSITEQAALEPRVTNALTLRHLHTTMSSPLLQITRSYTTRTITAEKSYLTSPP
jgi:hypothetical protein